MVAWNLWLFAILNTSETGLQVTQYFRYILGPGGERLTGEHLVRRRASASVILAALVVVTIRGLSVGKWVHKAGGIADAGDVRDADGAAVAERRARIAARRSIRSRPRCPVMSIFSLNIAAKMGFGALGGFEYVAIHAGECRNPARTITRSVALAAPIIAVMFILGTSSVLALVPIERIDLIAPIPQVLSVGFGALGSAAAVAPVTILVLLCIRVAQASVMFAGNTRAADGRRLGRPAAGVVHAPASRATRRP